MAITDASGTIQTEYTYDPWGEVLSVSGPNETLGTLNPFRYRGYYYDTDTGLYYLQSRYYDPDTGRFINSDDVNYIGCTESELSYNPFAYCNNSPVNDIDINGTISRKTIQKWFRRAFKKTVRKRLNWKWSVTIGVATLLYKVAGVKSNIGDIQKMTRRKSTTIVYTLLHYAPMYLGAEALAYFNKMAKAGLLVATITSCISVVLTVAGLFSGGTTVLVKSILKFIIGLIFSTFLPTLFTSIQMIWHGLKRHHGYLVTFSIQGWMSYAY